MEGGAYLVIAIAFGLAGGIVGRLKGSSFLLWGLISGLVPFLGLLAAILYRVESEELRKQCPRCGKVVKLYDALCMRCGNELDFPDVAIESESAARLSHP
jgi:ribosomal protein S27AE